MAGKKSNKVRQLDDLEEELGLEESAIRPNEGEAAEHGIYYDDTSYDYMQHMRELGGSTAATWIEAPQPKQKGKEKQRLEDALRSTSLEDDMQSLGGVSLAESKASVMSKQRTYQDMQDVPDVLAGFQPNMDPRLREVLEALDDEAYVDDEDEIFAQLAGDEEVDQDYWEDQLYDDEDEGWESDATEKPAKEYTTENMYQDLPPAPADSRPIDGATAVEQTAQDDGDWMASFAKSKGQVPAPNNARNPLPAPSDVASSAFTSATGRGKKRKGALTSLSGFSMTSSALARTESLSLLDARFDKIERSYMEDLDEEDEFNDDASVATGMTGGTTASRFSAWGGSQASGVAPQLMTSKFESVLDEFLGGSNVKGGHKQKSKGGSSKRMGAKTGMEQLDEIRGELGPARIRAASKAQKA